MDTLVQLQGNHTTLVRGLSPVDVEDILTQARKAQRQPDSEHEFVYLQEPMVSNEFANRVAVDPFAVVGVIGVGH